jgi:hypothetical protein
MRLPAEFDAAYPRRGPCAFCERGAGAHPGRLDARHRLLDAIRSRHRAGDSVEILCRDYDRTEREIRLVLETTYQ